METVYLYHQIKQIIPVVIIPYLAIIIFTIPYLVYQKYCILAKIRNVPASTILNINLAKVKKNLLIDSLKYNFILIIYGLEFTGFLGWSMHNIYLADLGHSDYSLITFIVENTTCALSKYNFIGFVFNAVGMVQICILPLMVLFLIVLRRAFLAVEYKNWIFGFCAYIFCRLLFLTLLSGFIITLYFTQIFLFPFVIFDSYFLFNSSRKFYLLLKGRRDEARWHSTRREYIEKWRIARTFAITQTIVLFVAFLLLIATILDFLIRITNILKESNCLFHYAFPNTQGCRGNGNLWVFPWVFPYGMGMGMTLGLWVFPHVGFVGFPVGFYGFFGGHA